LWFNLFSFQLKVLVEQVDIFLHEDVPFSPPNHASVPPLISASEGPPLPSAGFNRISSPQTFHMNIYAFSSFFINQFEADSELQYFHFHMADLTLSELSERIPVMLPCVGDWINTPALPILFATLRSSDDLDSVSQRTREMRSIISKCVEKQIHGTASESVDFFLESACETIHQMKLLFDSPSVSQYEKGSNSKFKSVVEPIRGSEPLSHHGAALDGRDAARGSLRSVVSGSIRIADHSSEPNQTVVANIYGGYAQAID
jgi:hypothetical protein